MRRVLVIKSVAELSADELRYLAEATWRRAELHRKMADLARLESEGWAITVTAEADGDIGGGRPPTDQGT